MSEKNSAVLYILNKANKNKCLIFKKIIAYYKSNL